MVALDGVQFIARFLQHVLPGGFKRIRHYGLLASAVKAEWLAGPVTAGDAAQVREDEQTFMRRVAVAVVALEVDSRAAACWRLP